MSHKCSVHLTCENYIHGNLPRVQKLVQYAGKLPRLFLDEDKTLVAIVDPSGLLGPPGSSLLWSITQIIVL